MDDKRVTTLSLLTKTDLPASVNSTVQSTKDVKIRKGKPNKEELVTKLRDEIADIMPLLIGCGTQERFVLSWLNEPWHMNSVREAYKWVVERLRPETDQLSKYLGEYDVKGWRLLYLTNASHPDIQKLESHKRRVRDEWFKRPRFKLERGRVESEGY